MFHAAGIILYVLQIVCSLIWKYCLINKIPFGESPPSEIVFQEQSYSSLHSGRSLAWDHLRGDIDDPCDVLVDFCGVIADPCCVVAIGGHAVGDADRCETH